MSIKDPVGEVLFAYGSQSGYESVPAVDESMFYVVVDKHRLYLGSKEYTRPILSGEEVPTHKAAPDSVYIRRTKNSFELYFTKDGTNWKKGTYVPDRFPEEVYIGPVPPEPPEDGRKLLWVDTSDESGEIIEEVDPTVPGWAKEPEKPTYNAGEVGALPDTTRLKDLGTDPTHRTVTDKEKETWNNKSNFSGRYNDLYGKPTMLSQFENDPGFLTYEEDPTVPSWAKRAHKPTYTADEVGADRSGAAVYEVKQHNYSNSAHPDLRSFIRVLEGKVKTIQDVLESPDQTLDELKEIVAYIKDNRDLIEQITTDKVNVADIIDDLISVEEHKKPLSAAMGAKLKNMIDDINEAMPHNKIVVQKNPPEDKSLLWVDLDDDTISELPTLNFFPDGVILVSPDGSKFLVEVDNGGHLSTKKIMSPI